MGNDKWSNLPGRSAPEEWVTEKDTNPPLPGALQELEESREGWEQRTVIERGF